MDIHNHKSCPRCGHHFECKAKDIGNCQCSTVQLSEQTLVFLSKTQYDCFCKDCLIAINDFVTKAEGLHFPSPKNMLVENLHYYKEGENWVFTELYHYLRGKCCGNACRHCVYGNALKSS